MRRLQVSVSGRWFLALTIGLGVIALGTGNNVLYLIESLLLAGLIFSGVLSERQVAALELEVHRSPAIAGAPSHDRVRVINQRRFTVFSVEVGEWGPQGFVPIAYIPKLGGKQSATLVSRQTFPKRGTHRWEGLAIATSYPFGFARKIRIIKAPGERVVWPERAGARRASRTESAGDQGMRSGMDFADAEVRAFTQDDDYRLIVWTLSAKGGDPVVRVRKSEQPNPEVTLDLRVAAASPAAETDFESRVRSAAQPFYLLGDNLQGGTLTVVDRNGRRRFHGRTQALNQLALAEPQPIRESA